MKTVADRAIPYLDPCFAGLGTLSAVDARDINPSLVRDAELLVVRTVTRVDAALLEGSRVRFVASPSAGVDHVDTGWLARAGIGFAHAPGCNARAVAEYVLSCLLLLATRRGRAFSDWRVGIVGCGQVGSRLGALLDALGVAHLDFDPPLQHSGRSGNWSERAALTQADLITLHVPLSDAGPYRTRGLVDAAFLAALRTDAILVNSARGGVVDEAALLEWLRANPGADCIIDTWQDEPDISDVLLQRTAVATPHVAGYSLEAKLAATLAVSRAARAFFGAAPPPVPELPAPDPIRITPGRSAPEALLDAVLGACDPRASDAALRRCAAEFADLRNNYRMRREFPAYEVLLPRAAPGAARLLRAAGFRPAGDAA